MVIALAARGCQWRKNRGGRAAGRTYEKKQPLRPTISLSGLHSNGKLPARRFVSASSSLRQSRLPSLLPNAP
jgi:hypothetical protein